MDDRVTAQQRIADLELLLGEQTRTLDRVVRERDQLAATLGKAVASRPVRLMFVPVLMREMHH